MNLTTLFSRLVSGPARPDRPATRSLDAAGGGRRWADDRRLTGAGTLHGAAPTIAARAAHFAINTPIGARIVETLVGNLVGDGIKPRSEHPDKAVRKALQEAFKTWIDASDADGRLDFFGLQQAACRDLVTFGEYVFLILQSPDTGAPQLRRLLPDQLDRSITRPTDNGGTIVQGVEFDAFGQIVAYHIRMRPNADPLYQMAEAPRRFPADVVLHGFRPLVPGQVRGISWMTPILLTANDYDRLVDAMIERAKVAALHAGFVRDISGSGSTYSGATEGGPTEQVSIEPGAMVHLPAGKEIEFATLPDQGGAAGVLKSTMQQIAAGVGITYEMASGDYSSVNYSSARAGILEFRRFASGVQFHTLVFPFCKPVYRRFVAYQAFRDVIPATEFMTNREPYERSKWLPPAWDWVDPEKDAKAAETLVRNRFKSRAEVIAEQGYDIEDVDAEFAGDEFANRPQPQPQVAPGGTDGEE